MLNENTVEDITLMIPIHEDLIFKIENYGVDYARTKFKNWKTTQFSKGFWKQWSSVKNSGEHAVEFFLISRVVLRIAGMLLEKSKVEMIQK